MEIGIILLNYNSAKDILRLVKELILLENIFIIIPDNSSGIDKRLLNLEKENPDKIKYIFNNRNLGYYKGNLVGVKYLSNKGKIERALILNPDIGCENWKKVITKLNKSFVDRNDNLFIVGPKIVIPGFLDVSTPKPKFSFLKETGYNLFFPFSYILLRKKQTKLALKKGNVFTVEGSAYMVDIKKFISIEKYFQNIFLYGEEVIFGLLANKKGWEIYFDNTIEVLHYHPPRQKSKIYDKYFLESLEEMCEMFNTSNLLKSILIFSVKYKKNIKRILLKIKR